jgi:serine/threonine protein kinase
MGPSHLHLTPTTDPSTSAVPHAAAVQPSSPCKRDRSPHTARSASVAVDDGSRRKGPWEALQRRPTASAAAAGPPIAAVVAGARTDGLPSPGPTSVGEQSRFEGLPAKQDGGWTASPNFFTSRRPLGSPASVPAAAAPGLTPTQSLASAEPGPIPRTMSPSLGLSRLSLPDGSVNRPFSPGDPATPAVRSPASSFLSAFSSPPGSIIMAAAATPAPSLSSAATSIIVSPDDQGQPAGGPDCTEVLGKLLGKGTSGIVREVLDGATGERVQPLQAVKVVSLRPKRTSPDEPETTQTLDELRAEIELWESLPTHPNILPLLRHVITADAVYLFMPFMPNGSLFDVVRRHKEHDHGRGRPRLFSSSRQAPVQIASVEGATNGATKAFPHDEARRLFTDVARGLSALHSAAIVHGDLKCENVLVNAEVRRPAPGTPTQPLTPILPYRRGVSKHHCRLSDFGFSIRSTAVPLERPSRTGTPPTWSSTLPATSSGGLLQAGPHLVHGNHRRHHLTPQPRQASSPFPARSPSAEKAPSAGPNGASRVPPGSLPYTAPELIRPATTPQPVLPTPASDVWALGVLLYFLVTSGSFPFSDAFEPRLQLKIIRGVWSLPEEIQVGKECLDVLRGCLSSDAGARWTIEEVLTSEWVQGWEEVKTRSRSRSRARSTARGRGSRSRSRASPSDRRSDGGFRPSTSLDRLSVGYANGTHPIGSPSTESTESFPPTPSYSMSPPPVHQRRPSHKSLAQASTETPTFSPSPSRSRSRSRGRTPRNSRRDNSPDYGFPETGVDSLTSLPTPAESPYERNLSRGRTRNPVYHDGHEALGRGRPRTPSTALSSFPEEDQLPPAA